MTTSLLHNDVHATPVESLLVFLLQTISIATEKCNVGVEVELRYGHRCSVGGTDFHLTISDCLIPGQKVSKSVTVPSVVQNEKELEEVKNNLKCVARFSNSMVRDSLERKRLLERREELLASMSDEDKYVLGISS